MRRSLALATMAGALMLAPVAAHAQSEPTAPAPAAPIATCWPGPSGSSAACGTFEEFLRAFSSLSASGSAGS